MASVFGFLIFPEVKLGHGSDLEFPIQRNCLDPVQTNFRPGIFNSPSAFASVPHVRFRASQRVLKINGVYRQYVFHILGGRVECYKSSAKSSEIFKSQDSESSF